MPFFTGTYLHTLDERNRIAMPAKLRPLLGERVAVNIGREACLVVYPYAVWEATGAQITRGPDTTQEEFDIRLQYFANALDVTVDGQGRVALTDYVCEAVGIKSEVAVVGAGDQVQIWDRETWIAKRAKLREKPASLPGLRPAAG
jgi:MraZ protein